MNWDEYFRNVNKLYNDDIPIIEKIKNVYRNNGYLHEQDFPKEYYFMSNLKTGEKVRIYYNGRVIEGD